MMNATVLVEATGQTLLAQIAILLVILVKKPAEESFVFRERDFLFRCSDEHYISILLTSDS